MNTNKILKSITKIHKKLYKFTHVYSRNIQMFNKIHKNYTNFNINTQETYKFSKIYNKKYMKTLHISIKILKKHTNVQQNTWKSPQILSESCMVSRGFNKLKCDIGILILKDMQPFPPSRNGKKMKN